MFGRGRLKRRLRDAEQRESVAWMSRQAAVDNAVEVALAEQRQFHARQMEGLAGQVLAQARQIAALKGHEPGVSA